MSGEGTCVIGGRNVSMVARHFAYFLPYLSGTIQDD